MLEAYVVDKTRPEADFEAVLIFEERQKSRHKCETTCGKVLAWFLERGQVLGEGDVLVCSGGERVKVVCAPQAVSEVSSGDALRLTRAAYHLGNRHVPLQIGSGFLRYQHDHVLDEMLEGLGLSVVFRQAPFQPENGAYHGRGASHEQGSDTQAGHGHHHG